MEREERVGRGWVLGEARGGVEGKKDLEKNRMLQGNILGHTETFFASASAAYRGDWRG